MAEMQEKYKGIHTEYDFTDGVRGKHHRAMQTGYSITVHQEDAANVTKKVVPPNNLIGDMVYSVPELPGVFLRAVLCALPGWSGIQNIQLRIVP